MLIVHDGCRKKMPRGRGKRKVDAMVRSLDGSTLLMRGARVSMHACRHLPVTHKQKEGKDAD